MTPVTDPELLKQLDGAGGLKPVTDPDLLKKLEGPHITDAVTDIPAEIGRTASSNVETAKSLLSNRGENASPFAFINTGKAVLSGLGTLASPVTGSLRSLIGHPMAQAEHAIGTVIAPQIAANDDPDLMYRNAASDVETALSAARPAGVTPMGIAAAAPKAVPAPSVGELKAAARVGYQAPEVAQVQIAPQAAANLSTKIESDLLQQGFRPRGQGAVFDEVKALTPSQGISSVGVADIDAARKALGIYAKEVDAVGKPTSQAAAASRAIDHINDFLPNLAPADVVAGDATAASQILKEAQENWGAAKRAEQVDLQLTRADRQAAKSGSGSNIENSMRQKIATLLDNPRRTVGFSDAEKHAMEAIVRGTASRNALRKAGKLGVDGGLSLLLHSGTALSTGGANLPIAAAGTAARKIGEALTARSGSNLSEMVRSRSPLATRKVGTHAVQHALLSNSSAPVAAAIPYSAIVSALLASPARR
jgi:hypothetical protein